MTTRTTYNFLRRGIATLALVCISVITFAQDPEPTYVAKIGDTEYTTLQAAISAAEADATIELIADITETATYTINKQVSINLGTYNITASHNDASSVSATKVFDIQSAGNLTITGTGTITDAKVSGIFYNAGTLTINGGNYTTTVDDYGVVVNDGGICIVTGGTLTGAYAAIYGKGTNNVTVNNGSINGASIGIQATAGTTLNVTGGTITATNESKKYPGLYLVGEGTTVTVSGGTISGWDGISVCEKASLTVNAGATINAKNAAVIGNGNDGQGNTTITINGGTMTSEDTGIYHPQVGTLTINDGAITGGKLGVEIRAGELSVTDGTITATADTYSCVANTNGTTTIGAALAIAQHTTKQNISVTISGGEFTGVKAISESNPQQNDPAPQVAMSVTNGTFNGGITVVDVQNGFISGGTYSTVDANFGGYLQSGYAVKANAGDPATYAVVAQTSTTINPSITGADKDAADALAANTATTTTEGLEYNQSLEISIQNVTVDGGVVKTATFEVTPKDVNGNTIENASISAPITFRLPISNTVAEGKWVNLKHNGTPITGNTVEADGTNRYVAVTTTSFSPFEYQVLLNDPVAQIGETKYETITEAIAEAPNNTATTIELLADITTDFEVTAGKNIILTIDEYTISGNITNAGTLAISDGTISGTITNSGSGTLAIASGTYTGTITKSSGTIEITGGTFTNEPESGWIADGYEVMVGGATNELYVVAAEGTAEAKIVTVVAEVENTVKYQTIVNAVTAASTNETTITVLKDITENFTIAAGQNITLSVTTHTISGAITNEGTLKITDGTFTGAITNNNETEGSLTITGGTFQIKPTGYTCEEGFDLIINENGVYEVTDIASAEAQISDNKYLTIGDAITAAGTEETTITLLKDLEGEDRSITIPAGANITLIVANEVTLTKPVINNGTLTISSGTISGAITIANTAGRINIAAAVTLDNTSVALSTELSQAKNVLKTQTTGEPAVTTYWVEKMFVATVDLTGEPTTEQTSAATTLANNNAIFTEVTGLDENQSLTITVTDVTLGTDNKVKKATFEVKLIGADGEPITTPLTDAVGFNLPILYSSPSSTTWVNLWHDATDITGTSNIQGAGNDQYIALSSTSFSPFSYEIVENPIAQIGETKYETVAEAITAAATAETEIKLLRDVDSQTAISVSSGQNVKLTIGTHTLSGGLTNNGTLAIADGTISGAITNTGALAISGTATSITGAVSATAGTLAISGGTFSDAITTSDGAGLNITGGTIIGALTVGGSGTNTISGGTISGAVTTNAATTISGGTFDATSSITNCGALSVTGGIFEFSTAITNNSPGTVAISGGTHTALPVAAFCATGYMPIKTAADAPYTVTNAWTIVDETDLSINSHLNGGTYSVETATYNRNTGMVSAGNTHTKYGTICLPFDITAQPTGMTLYKATSITDTELTITEVTDFSTPIPAGTPLIFELSDVASSMTVTSSNAAVNTTAPATAPVTGNLLVGTYTELNLTEALNTKYYLNGDHFHQAVQSLKVPAFRAYLDATSSSSKPATIAIVKETEETEETTAIENMDTEADIVAIYDAMGHKFGSLQKGMNIVLLTNGKSIKVIVK